MNTITEIARTLLWACIEDYAGLWELLWEVNSKFPMFSDEERKRGSLEAMQLLLDRGLIKLYRCKEPYGDLSELDADAVRGALSEEDNWKAPEFRDVSIRAGATKDGEALYQSGAFDSLCN